MQQRLWYFVGALVLAVVTGIGGYFYGTSVGEARASQARQTFLQERLGGGQAGQNSATGQSGQFGAGRQDINAVAGQVKSVDGKTIEVSTRDNVTKVSVDDKTQVTKMCTGTLEEIKPGERIVVQGDGGASGAVTARSIQIVTERGQP